MFPLRDDIPSRRYPLVNLGLILLSIVGFAYELWLGKALDGFIQTHGFVPARFAEQWAAGALAAGVASVFTSMFLHSGLLHLFSNLWTLWIFGDNVEDSMGHSRYLLFYLLCGAISVLAQAGSAPEATMPLVWGPAVPFPGCWGHISSSTPGPGS